MTSKRQQVWNSYQETGSVAETARRLGIHQATARYHIQKFRSAGPAKSDKPQHQAEQRSEEIGRVSFVHVEIWGPNLGVKGEQIHVHAKGCADTKKGLYKQAGKDARWICAVESQRDLVEAVYPPEDFQYDPETELDQYAADIRVFPCVELPQGG